MKRHDGSRESLRAAKERQDSKERAGLVRAATWLLANLSIRLLALPFLRRYGSNSRREQLMSRDINWSVSYFCACRVLAEKVVTLPVRRRSDGSGNKAAATVRADVAQHMIDAGGTKRTFISADARLR